MRSLADNICSVFLIFSFTFRFHLIYFQLLLCVYLFVKYLIHLHCRRSLKDIEIFVGKNVFLTFVYYRHIWTFAALNLNIYIYVHIVCLLALFLVSIIYFLFSFYLMFKGQQHDFYKYSRVWVKYYVAITLLMNLGKP